MAAFHSERPRKHRPKGLVGRSAFIAIPVGIDVDSVNRVDKWTKHWLGLVEAAATDGLRQIALADTRKAAHHRADGAHAVEQRRAVPAGLDQAVVVKLASVVVGVDALAIAG